MRKLHCALYVLFCLSLGFFSPSESLAAELTKPVELTLVAQQPGTSMYQMGMTLSRFLQDALPEGSKITVIPRGASISNPMVIDQHKGDISFSSGCAVVWAWNGLPGFFDSKHQNIREVSLGQMSVSFNFACARRSYVESTGNDTLEKVLQDKNMPRLIMKPKGSQVEPIFAPIFEHYGKPFEDFRKANKLIQLQPTQIGDVLRDGRADVYIESIQANHPAFTEISLTNDLVFLPLPQWALDNPEKFGMVKGIMPKGSYRGVDEDYPLLSTSGNIIAHKDAPEEVVYLLTKALIERHKEFIDENPTMNTWDPFKDHTRTGSPVPLHPGAERYYREKGWIK